MRAVTPRPIGGRETRSAELEQRANATTVVTSKRARMQRVAGRMVLPLLALILSSLPYLYGYAIRPDGTRFWAVPPANAQDANQYLAIARTIAEGQFLVGNSFTSEAHVPRLLVPEAVLQAALGRAFGWTSLAVFHITRIVFGACLLLAAWRLGAVLTPRRSLQHLYMGFVCFSAGGGWLVDLLRPGTAHGDRYQPEGNTLFLLGNLPHLILAAALLTGLFATRAALGRGRTSHDAGFLTVMTALLSLLLSWTHPWDFVPLILGTGAYGLFLLIEEERIPWASILHLGAVGVGALPAGMYFTWLVLTDPIYAAMANDVMEVHRWPFYLIAHGLLALPAVLVLVTPKLRSRYALPLCWVICVFVFLCLPFRMGGKQSRLPGGVHVPLALLAAVGVEHVGRATLKAIRRTRRAHDARWMLPRFPQHVVRPLVVKRAICFGYLGVTSIGAVAILHRHWSQYAPRTSDYYQTPGTQALYEQLDNAGHHEQVTLGGPITAGWAPALADTRTYHGHWHLTINEPEKRAARDWFFRAAATPDQRASWLAAHRITWVIWCPWEWNSPIVPLDDVPGLQRVFVRREIILYRFVGLRQDVVAAMAAPAAASFSSSRE